MYIITVDAKQGYHKVTVRECGVEKLALFAPDHKKYDFKVIPFEPVNSPAFYSCMMINFKREWDTLFLETTSALAIDGTTLDGQVVNIQDGAIFIRDK